MSLEDKFTLSYSKKEHNRSRRDSQELNRDDLILKYDGSVDNMKHFVGPAFIMCNILPYYYRWNIWFFCRYL